MSRHPAPPPDDSGLPAELRATERELGRLETPGPRADFRALLRARFVSGDFESAAEDVLARWQTPPARGAFRAELRERFLGEAPLAGAHESTVAPRARISARAIRRLALIAAAALVLLVPFLRPVQAQGWRVVSSPGVDSVMIDGAELPSADSARLHERLSSSGCRLESGGRFVRFARDRGLLLHVEPETSVRLSPFFALRDEGLLVDLRQGAVVVSLSKGFSERIVVDTPYGRVEVNGRAIGVELIGGGLCICCLEGEAHLLTKSEQQRQVTAGTSLFLQADGTHRVKDDGVAHLDLVAGTRAAAGEHLEP